MSRALADRLATWGGANTATPKEVMDLAQWAQRLDARVNAELTNHTDKIKRGMELAKQEGRSIGRLRVDFDIAAAHAMFVQGHGTKYIARRLGASYGTVRRRLREIGDIVSGDP